jgi:hypothetical protein
MEVMLPVVSAPRLVAMFDQEVNKLVMFPVVMAPSADPPSSVVHEVNSELMFPAVIAPSPPTPRTVDHEVSRLVMFAEVIAPRPVST